MSGWKKVKNFVNGGSKVFLGLESLVLINLICGNEKLKVRNFNE